jgi:hypothetical protein
MTGMMNRRLASDLTKLSRVRPASGAFNALTETGKIISIYVGSHSGRGADDTSGMMVMRALTALKTKLEYCIFVIRVI